MPRVIQQLTSSVVAASTACNEPSEHQPFPTLFTLQHSAKARRNIELQRQELKRQRQQQANRNPYNDGYEFDPAADPRFVAAQRNKRAQELAKQLDKSRKTIEAANKISDTAKKILKVVGTNNIVKFVRSEETSSNV